MDGPPTTRYGCDDDLAAVSILIPAFNAEQWIAETLESALGQTWPHKEIIVVDDGSSDRTGEIVAGFEPRGVKLIRQENLGQCAAENRAFRESEGDVVQYLDADDLLSRDKISLQMARIDGATDVVASCEWARFYSHPSEAVFAPEPVWRDLDPVEWLISAFTGGLPMMQAAIYLIPRAVALRAGPWDERLTLINDFDYFTRVLLAAREVRFCRGARLYYRSGNPDTLSRRKSPSAWESAILSLELGTAALLERDDSPRARRACADVFQEWAYAAYLENDRAFERAEARAAILGGSLRRMEGGLAFRILERAFGWRVAKRVKAFAHRHGFGRVSPLKARLGRRRTQGWG
jgi:glycosyltransferase involved in cell wall biosynthesis